jgi:hypothetical protein
LLDVEKNLNDLFAAAIGNKLRGRQRIWATCYADWIPNQALLDGDVLPSVERSRPS